MQRGGRQRREETAGQDGGDVGPKDAEEVSYRHPPRAT